MTTSCRNALSFAGEKGPAVPCEGPFRADLIGREEGLSAENFGEQSKPPGTSDQVARSLIVEAKFL